MAKAGGGSGGKRRGLDAAFGRDFRESRVDEIARSCNVEWPASQAPDEARLQAGPTAPR